MKKKLLRRIATIATAAALGVGACAMFAGCSSNNPEVTITYTFNGKDYEVGYTLSRLDAPNTVQHFIELADAGFYDGLCVHDYQNYYMYMGGYKIEEGENGQESALVEVDYFSEVRRLEAEKQITFTQSVWKLDDTPLYTVYGEFSANGNVPENGSEITHSDSQAVLAMFYTAKGNFNAKVKTVRNDGGANNNGNPYDTDKGYEYNSATSMFYTFWGQSAVSKDETYCVFGKTVDKTGQFQPLLDAISAYIDEHSDDESETEYAFTEEQLIPNVNTLEQGDDPDFETLRRGNIEATYKTPIEAPIIIKSVKVTKY